MGKYVVLNFCILVPRAPSVLPTLSCDHVPHSQSHISPRMKSTNFKMATCSHEYVAQVAIKHADLIGQWKILSLIKSDTASSQTKTCNEYEGVMGKKID